MLWMLFNVDDDGRTSIKSLTLKRKESEAKNGAGIARTVLFGDAPNGVTCSSVVDTLADDDDDGVDNNPAD